MEQGRAIAGGCLCGAVRFELDPPLGGITHCHCRSCRLSHGAPFVTWTSVRSDRFRLLDGEGALSWYRSSTQIRWGFCSVCGSSMLYIADQPGHPEEPQVGWVYVVLASLAGGFADRPAAHVSWEEHLAWIEGLEALPRRRGKSEERIA
ncbi:MAG: GFA family protein [Caulobacteraceae bacterium]